MGQVHIKRAYDVASNNDGYRVLVDRIWPRGVSKEKAHVNWWAKDVAPTTELRKWYGHKEERWEEFRARYLKELDDETHRHALQQLRDVLRDGDLTLITATKKVQVSAAQVLYQVLRDGTAETEKVCPA
ncbi:DUF488 family protein [Actinotignum urinale]|uniref:DUF488 family protein n=1 Tax=Actinotignum urinale TaxID=190146 RepID=A0ABU5G724_9ACTO|nr:DUF488 family protein [Actinotignum urinale]MDY5133147.1 DUF488 family protein [Actinotignum urinale]MDY5151672.1 DUF488 family protein [Actinotignum urinale]